MKKINDILHKLEEKNRTASKLGGKIIKILAIVLVAVVLLIILIIASSIGMFNWLTLEVRTITGLDVFLAKGVALILLAIFFGTPLSGFAWSLFPIPQKNKKRKRFIFLSVLAILFFTAYFASKNVYFNPKDGKPMKYFSVGVNGEYNFSNYDGYDPITGDKLKRVDKETIIKYLKEKNSSKTINSVSNDYVSSSTYKNQQSQSSDNFQSSKRISEFGFVNSVGQVWRTTKEFKTGENIEVRVSWHRVKMLNGDLLRPRVYTISITGNGTLAFKGVTNASSKIEVIY